MLKNSWSDLVNNARFPHLMTCKLPQAQQRFFKLFHQQKNHTVDDQLNQLRSEWE